MKKGAYMLAIVPTAEELQEKLLSDGCPAGCDSSEREHHPARLAKFRNDIVLYFACNNRPVIIVYNPDTLKEIHEMITEDPPRAIA